MIWLSPGGLADGDVVLGVRRPGGSPYAAWQNPLRVRVREGRKIWVDEKDRYQATVNIAPYLGCEFKVLRHSP